jgi:hypothetical protein
MTEYTNEQASEEFGRVSAESALALARSMDETGVGILHDIVPESILAKLRSAVTDLVEQNGSKYQSFSGADWIANTCLAPLFHDVEFRSLLHRLYAVKFGSSPCSERILPVMRVLTGPQGQRHSNNFHYDSYIVTVLLPILIPDGDGEPHGDLVMYPNLREARRSASINILEKIVVEKILKRIWRVSRLQTWLSAKVVHLTPGNLYFFWGMRSLHANRPCAPTKIRCTVLLHFGDPHERSLFKRVSHHLHAMSLRRLSRD